MYLKGHAKPIICSANCSETMNCVIFLQTNMFMPTLCRIKKENSCNKLFTIYNSSVHCDLYVYHTCTRALHMSSPVANRSIVDLGATVQKNKGKPNAILVMHGDCTHYQELILNSWHSRPLKQPIQNSCPSLVTFKPILTKYAAHKYGGEKTACNVHV